MSVTEVFDRHLHLDGSFNFRDLGGYATMHGGWVRPRSLYRADGPHLLSAADRVRLDDLRLASVIDLRTRDEISQHGCYTAVLPAVRRYDVPMLDVIPDVEELTRWTDPETVAARYRDMLAAGHDSFAEILAILSDPSSYPCVVHCSAGKDRTGIVAAVLLGLLAVPDETIIADYALSGPATRRLVEHLRQVYPDSSEWLDRVAPAMIGRAA